MRPRIKHKILVGSSDQEKILTYRESLRVNHEQNIEYFKHINETVKLKKRYYIRCWGKLIPVPDNMLVNFSKEELIEYVQNN